jgi:hypothetical protein
MTSNIRNFLDNIDTNFPVQGRDNPSQGFRDNFAQIKLALVTTADELENIVIASNTQTFTLTPATTSTIGGVKIGAGFRVNPDGTIFIDEIYTLPTATGSVLGGVKVGSNIDITNGIISVAAPYVLSTATGSALGGVKVGFGLAIDNNGVLGINTATNFPFDIPIATSGVLGAVKIGANVAVSGDGTISVTAPYSLPPANTVTRGGVTIGANITVDNDGNISVAAPYSLPTATGSVLGGVKIGSGISIDGGGVISAPYSYTLPQATSSTLGGVVVGDNISVLNGVISVAAPYELPTASNNTKGGIKVGNGLTIDGNGFLNIQAAPLNLSAVAQHILPTIDVAYDLGSASNRFRDIYLSGNTINLGGSIITANATGGITVPGGVTSGLSFAGFSSTENNVFAVVSADRKTMTFTPPLQTGWVLEPTIKIGQYHLPIQPLDEATFSWDYSNGEVNSVTLLTGGSGYPFETFGPEGTVDGGAFYINPNPLEEYTVTGIDATEGLPGIDQFFVHGTPQFNVDGVNRIVTGSATVTGQLRNFAYNVTFGLKFSGNEIVVDGANSTVTIDQGTIPASNVVIFAEIFFNGNDWVLVDADAVFRPDTLFVEFTFNKIQRLLTFSPNLTNAIGNSTVNGNFAVGGELTVDSNIKFPDGTILVSAIPTLPLYTTSTLNTIVSTATGAMVLVTNFSGGLPCFYDGTRWKTFTGTII